MTTPRQPFELPADKAGINSDLPQIALVVPADLETFIGTGVMIFDNNGFVATVSIPDITAWAADLMGTIHKATALEATYRRRRDEGASHAEAYDAIIRYYHDHYDPSDDERADAALWQLKQLFRNTEPGQEEGGRPSLN